MKSDRRIAQPDWLEDAMPRVEQTFKLYRDKKIPDCIEVFLLSVPLKHALRGIYGGNNITVAWILLKGALHERCRSYYWYLRFRLGLEKEIELEMDEVEGPEER